MSGAATLLAYRLLSAGVAHAPELVLASALETCAIGLCWLGAEVRTQSRLSKLLAVSLYYTVFYALFVFGIGHTYFFAEATQRRFSLLDIGASSISYFFSHLLPLDGYLAFALVFAVSHALAVGCSRRALVPGSRALAVALLCAVPLVLLAAARAERVPTPLFDVALDLREIATHRHVRVDSRARPPTPLPELDKSQPRPLSLDTPFKKVVVVVMETMWTDKAERERRALESGTFVNASRAHAHSYRRYVTSNQDSRTAVLALLGSRFIPYEAYSEAGRDHYLHLSRLSSLVDLFRSFGYETAFAASQTEIELVVDSYPWHELLMLTDADLRAAKSSFLCFTPYEFEHSCEDKALLPKVTRFLDAHERAFVVQQMIWGHASEYNQASGKTNMAYYSEYLDALVAHLRARGELDSSLIVLTADHGLRERDAETDPSVYSVPLSFVSPLFSASEDDGLFSHLDFKDLLLREMTRGAWPVRPNEFVLSMGTTTSSLIAVSTGRGDFLVIKDRPFLTYLLREQRARADEPLDPGSYVAFLQAYRERFERAGIQ